MSLNYIDLKTRQSLPLESKIDLTKRKIMQWVNYWDQKSWNDNKDYMPYISFSGGKDSTVLVNMAREIYPDIPLVFIDTGLEYPEVRKFVKSFIKENEIPKRIELKTNKQTKNNLCDIYEKSNLYIIYPKIGFKQVIENYGYPVISKEVSNCIKGAYKEGSVRWKRIHGKLMNGDKKSLFNCNKWEKLLYAPFKCSDSCCYFMKRQPIYAFEKFLTENQ